jgi:hypothetical protein
VSADDTNGRGKTMEYVVTDRDEDMRALERRVGMLDSFARQTLGSISDKLQHIQGQYEFIEDFLRAINAKIDRALNNLDGLDVRKRLALVEESVADRPRRTTRQKAK